MFSGALSFTSHCAVCMENVVQQEKQSNALPVNLKTLNNSSIILVKWHHAYVKKTSKMRVSEVTPEKGSDKSIFQAAVLPIAKISDHCPVSRSVY